MRTEGIFQFDIANADSEMACPIKPSNVLRTFASLIMLSLRSRGSLIKRRFQVHASFT